MKFPIQRKSLVGFGVASVVLITINVLFYWSFLQHQETDYWVAHTYQVQQKIEATLAELMEAETGQRGYLLIGEEDYLKTYNNSVNLIDKQISELERLTVDNPRQQQRINTLRPLVVRRLAALSQVIELRKKRGFEAALTGVKTSQGSQIMARIRDVLREMEDEEAVLLKQRLRAHEVSGRTQSLVFSAGIVFNVVVFYWLYRAISREIARRKRTQAALEKANEALEITVTQLKTANEQLQSEMLDREQAQSRQRSSEERYRQLSVETSRRAAELTAVIESIPDTIYIGTATEITICNLSALEMFGVDSIDQLNEINLAQLTERLQVRDANTGRPMPPGELCFDYALRGETKVCEVLVRHRKTDRDLVIRSASAPIWYNGEIIGAVAIHTDITERKQVEKERSEMLVQLEAKSGLLEAVLQQMTAGVIVGEAPSGRLMLRNEQVTQLLGDAFALADNIEQYQQYQGLHTDGRPYAPDEWPMARSISTGEVVTNEEINYLCGDGTYRLLSVSSTPVRNHKGEIIAGVVTFYDLTDTKKAQEELRKTLVRERELSELRSSFVSLVSHEFRTPLTTIQSSAELLERYQERLPSEKKLAHYHRIQSAISQMTHLLNEVLLIGQAEAGKLQFNPQLLELVPFCRELVEGMQAMVDNRHSGKTHEHRLSFTVSGECEDAQMDEKLLRHILTNLLSNAIKYSPDGGTVQFDLIGNDHDVMFQVTDSGIGIPEEDKKQLFNSFSRASNVGTIQGTGLGLAIVKKSVDLHGGQITVSSVAGKGTTFTVTLPKKPVS